MAQSSTGVPKNAGDSTPTNGWLETEDLTFAPRRAGRVQITSFIQEDEDIVKREFSLADNRVGSFEFDKMRRCVSLYSTDLGEERSDSDPCLFLPIQDWLLFYNRVWRDLHECLQEPVFIAEWSGVTPGMRYRVACDGCGTNPDDNVYIFSSNALVKISESIACYVR